MAQVNLMNESFQVDDTNDSIVIRIVSHTIPGGRALNVVGYPEAVLKAGHVIIKQDSNGDFKPMPVTVSAAINAIGSLAGGSGYAADGTYPGVALTGGAGSGATADITVEGGTVTNVVIVNKGSGYVIGNNLSAAAANIGGDGSGFQITVSEVSQVPTGYASLPAGHSYVGLLRASILTRKPSAAIVTAGQANPSAMPFSMTSILSAFKTAVPLIEFQAD